MIDFVLPGEMYRCGVDVHNCTDFFLRRRGNGIRRTPDHVQVSHGTYPGDILHYRSMVVVNVLFMRTSLSENNAV